MRRALIALGSLALATGAAAQSEPAAQGADPVARGKYLATVGDCAACHTETNGKPFAGGLMMNTPFGQISTPNITPDPETGIGKWSEADLYRVFHDGKDREGNWVYPAMPYPWYTKVTKEDVAAIYAYLKSLPPVHNPRKPNTLAFPFNIRAGLAAWDAAFFQPGTFQPDSKQSPEWNRGAYLVEGLGHCGECHSQKNAAMAPIRGEMYAGGQIDKWYAPNITSDPKEGIGAWSDSDLVQYLKTGSAPGKGVAIGPMAETVHKSLSQLTDSDLHAIAIYLKSVPPKHTFRQEQMADAGQQQPGQPIYLSYCAGCHTPSGQGIRNAVPTLAGNGAVAAKGPENVIRAITGGLQANASYGPMPGFATILSAQQIADVTNYVRTSWGNGAPATATADQVGSILSENTSMLAGTAPHWCQKIEQSDVTQALDADKAGLKTELAKINDTNMLPEINTIVTKAKQAAPNAKQDSLVNGLTYGYCEVLKNDTSGTPQKKLASLDRFAELVYTQLSNKEQY